MSQILVEKKKQKNNNNNNCCWLSSLLAILFVSWTYIIRMFFVRLSEEKENKKIVFPTKTIWRWKWDLVSCSSDALFRSSFLIYISLWLLSLPGVWTPWSPWVSCSRSCGGGTRSRTRSCINRSQFSASAVCRGPRSRTQRCNINVCPSKDYRYKLKMRLNSVMK